MASANTPHKILFRTPHTRSTRSLSHRYGIDLLNAALAGQQGHCRCVYVGFATCCFAYTDNDGDGSGETYPMAINIDGVLIGLSVVPRFTCLRVCNGAQAISTLVGEATEFVCEAKWSAKSCPLNVSLCYHSMILKIKNTFKTVIFDFITIACEIMNMKDLNCNLMLRQITTNNH